MKSVFSALVDFLLICAFCSGAQADQFLGEGLVATGSCRNTVIDTGGVCGFQAIRVDVLNLAMRVSGMTVTFNNGLTQFIGVTPYITPGTSSDWKSLEDAGNGCVRSVEITGQADGAPGSSAEIQIFGLL